jgi:glycosyltransferase involved in cell wall biosynthesis
MTVHFVVPFYGEPALFIETIRSICGLTNPHWRLSIVDDGWPTDEVAEHIAGLADARISYRRNEERKGTAGNLFRCLAIAEDHEAPIVNFLGADDLVEPNYVDVVRRALDRHPEAVIVQPGVTVIDEAGNPIMPLGDRIKRISGRSARRRGVVSGEPAVARLLHGNWLYWPSLALRRDALRRTRWRPDIDGISDFAHAVDLLLDGSSIVVDETPAFRYRRHAANDSSTRAASGIRWEQEDRYYDEIAGTLRAQGWDRAARAADLHLSSRLHAATVRIAALRARRRRRPGATVRQTGRTA